MHGKKELSNGDAELHQEALNLSPLKAEVPAKHSTITPIDMQGVCEYKALLRKHGHWCICLPASGSALLVLSINALADVLLTPCAHVL